MHACMRETLLQPRHEEAQHRGRGIYRIVIRCCAGFGLVAVSMACMAGNRYLARVTLHQTEHAPEFVGLWDQEGRAARDRSHELFFTIRQKNQILLEQMVHDMINPASPNFRRWLTKEEVEKITRNDEGIRAVREALSGAGVLRVAEIGGHFVRAQASVIVWEKFLQAEFHLYRHRSLGHIAVRANSFTIPLDLHEHVDGVLGILDLDHVPIRDESEIGSAGFVRNLSASARVVPTELFFDPGYVTPAKLRRAYEVPDPSELGSPELINSATSQAVFSSLMQDWSPEDRREFIKEFNLPWQPVRQIDKNGGYGYAAANASNARCKLTPGLCTEGNLDVQYMLAMSPWSDMGVFYQQARRNLFDHMVVSLAAMSNPPHVISISHGIPEIAKSVSLIRTFDSVACKLAAQGVTLVASSGDDGANALASYQSDCGRGLGVSWPASSPWVTAVGATMGVESGFREIACSTDAKGPTARASVYQPTITSGGGYSQKVPRPFWQDGALKDDRTYRGIPDVSLAGHAYVIRNGGQWMPVDGTSASAPAFAGMVSILNAHLNKQPVEKTSTGASQLAAEPSDGSCEKDTGGTCTVFHCHLNRGPTKCVKRGMLHYACECPDGYCSVNGVCEPKDKYKCGIDTGGTCLMLPCKNERGPTQCVKYGVLTYKCICPLGFCAIDGICTRTSSPDQKKSVGWLNPLLYENPDSFTDITEGSNRCASKGRPCCGGYATTEGWDPVTGLGVVNFARLAKSLNIDL